MNCPYCQAELEHHDTFGRFHNMELVDKRGDIYKCPNYEGFEDPEQLAQYRAAHPELKDVKDEDIVCGSAEFNGSFHTHNSDDLHEGYPC